MPPKIYSLLGLMDSYLYQLATLMHILWQQEESAKGKVALMKMNTAPAVSGVAISSNPLASNLAAFSALTSPTFLNDDDKFLMEQILPYAAAQCKKLELEAGMHRVEVFTDKLKGLIDWSAYESEIRALREAIEGEIKNRYFCYYKKTKVELWLKREEQWKKTLSAYKSARSDIESAIKCYAAEQDTACIFHLMRVAEYGLRALARERKISVPRKPLDWATWEDLLGRLRGKVNAIKNWRAGIARDRALEFYQGALGHFESFKDVYRNNVMHSRSAYDEGRATSVLNHVREFMEILSDKIGEDNKTSIKWRKANS